MPKTRTVWFALPVLGCAAVVCLLSIRPHHDFPALHETDPGAFNYSMHKKTYRDLTVRFRLEPARKRGPFAARVVLAWDDDRNHDFLHLTRERLWLGKTEAGLERRVGPDPQPYDPGQEVVLRRWQGKTTVFVGGRFVAEAGGEDSNARRAVGYGATTPSVRVVGFRPQRLESIHFADDFMSAEENAVSWETLSGEWGIRTIKNPLRSANAFRFAARANGEAAMATAGYAFWHDYRFDVACRPSGPGVVGVILYRDNHGHYRFEWSAGTQGRKRLVHVADGVARVLLERQGGYVADQWYTLSAEVTGRRLRCFVDGHRVGDIQDDRLVSGGIGLYVDGELECSFDDVVVRSIDSFQTHFRDPLLTDWRQVGGTWQVAETGSLTGLADAPAPGPAKLVTGVNSWHSYDLSTVFRMPAGSAAGLCFCYQDEGDHYRMEVTRGSVPNLQLVKVAGGGTTVVAQTSLTAEGDGGFRLRAVVEQNVIRTYANGREVLPATWTSDRPTGRVGLCVRNGEAVFSEFSVVPLEPFDQSVVGAPRTFSHEKSMANWASAEGEWLAAQEQAGGEEVTTFWHRADVPGDGGISARLPLRDPSSGQPWRFRLFYNTDTAVAASGYTALLSTGSGSAQLRLELSRDGDVLESGVLPTAQNARTLRLQRVGRIVTVWLDGQLELKACDLRPPATGLRAGWCSQRIAVEHDDVSVFSRNVHLDDFRKAPVDWRVPAGLWDVTTRWECDPRWSFFSGRGGMFAASDDKLAAMWHKRGIPGDFTVEFTVGQKMAREFGSYADYTRDFNVTVCGDGRDLTSGYTCTLGGWHNTKTAILRGRDVVAETEATLIPRSNSMHRQWFNIKVRRRASLLSFLVDDEIVLEYDDPNPLPGTRVALWTYDNGFMISRFRVSAEELGPSEEPGAAQDAACRSFYDPLPEPHDDAL